MPLAEIQPKTDIEPGTYEAVVFNVVKDTIVPRQGKQAGQDVPILRWSFVVEGVEEELESITGRDPSSEKSNLFKYFVALLGADRKKWDAAEAEDLIGRPCLITVILTDEGWPRIDSLSGRPVKRPTPVETTKVDVHGDEKLDDDLPF
jgi:hypothetical protein